MDLRNILGDKLYDEIVSFCKLNGLVDVSIFVGKLVRCGFNIEKYGNTPFPNSGGDEVEKLKRKIKNLESELIKVKEKETKKFDDIEDVKITDIKEVNKKKDIYGE